jgi:predicted phage tail component-like protein
MSLLWQKEGGSLTAPPSFIKIKSVNFQTLPVLSPVTTKIAGRNGLVYSGTELGEKIINVAFIVIPPANKTLMECGEELANWLGTGGIGTLRVNDYPNKQFKAYISNPVNIGDGTFIGSGQFDFIVPSGLAEGTIVKTVEATADTFTIDYTGTAPVFPVVTVNFTGTVSEFRLTNTGLSEQIIVNGSFTSGDTLVIDNDKKKIELNGNIFLSGMTVNSDWVVLNNGENNFTKSGLCEVAIDYREKFI